MMLQLSTSDKNNNNSMKHTHIIFSAFTIIAFWMSPVFAQDPALWKPLHDMDIRNLELSKNPAAFKVYQMDKAGVLDFLQQTSTTALKSNLLSLPDPEGNFHQFEVFETPVLASRLQAEYPQIRTYTAICSNDKNTTAKITMSTLGINIVVYSLKATYFITPVNDKDRDHYLVFNKKDYSGGFAPVNCQESDERIALSERIPIELNSNAISLKTNGETRRKFRCAITCTGEWAHSVMENPTLPDIMSFITTVMNGANGVYERELALTLELVPQEASLIYLDPATDPYSGNNNTALLSESQNNLDAILTNSGYDIGLMLTNNGGGLAVTGSICDMDYKGTAVSESLWPSDYGEIIHEMGHQMGSKHTFNSNQNFCNGYGYAPAAYEAGSGSTIMGYPFVCGVDNVLKAATDYYNVYSLDNITTLINNSSLITCGSVLPGTSSVISLDTSLQEFYIPLHTPFELTAPETQFSDPDGAINFCWEQWDLGNFGGFEYDAPFWTEGPSFQSFDPTTNRTRSFPRIDTLKDNQYSVAGERLPRVPRDLHFRLTVRSLQENWGTYNSDKNVTVHVADLDSFRVTAPNDGALWEVGATVAVNWTPGGSTLMPVNCNNVNIYLSPDGGKTFPYLIGSNVPNTGNFNFTVMNIYSDSVIIKVKGADNIFFDISKPFNKIHGNPTSIAENSTDEMLNIYPNPANHIVTIEAKNQQEKYTYSITDVSGKVLRSGYFQGITTIDISNLANGVYFFRFKDKSEVNRVRKIVKKQ